MSINTRASFSGIACLIRSYTRANMNKSDVKLRRPLKSLDYFSRELVDAVIERLPPEESIAFRSAFGFEPWPSEIISQSPWPVIFRSGEWLDKVVEKYKATPLLIGRDLAELSIKRDGYVALYIGAETPISDEDRQLFYRCLHKHSVNSANSDILIQDGDTSGIVVLNIRDTHLSGAQKIVLPVAAWLKRLFYNRLGEVEGTFRGHYSFYRTQQVREIQTIRPLVCGTGYKVILHDDDKIVRLRVTIPPCWFRRCISNLFCKLSSLATS
jgi:hypothetical protein